MKQLIHHCTADIDISVVFPLTIVKKKTLLFSPQTLLKNEGEKNKRRKLFQEKKEPTNLTRKYFC